jgi:hypothetical protein
MDLNRAELHCFAMETARDILKQMPWDYDPDRDVWKIAEIIEKNHVLKEYDVWLKN